MGPFNQDNDSLLAEKLRREDPEQYHTLIRMHLSFVLDLNTDDCDSGSDKAKNRVLKWNLLPFVKKSKVQTKGVMEGAPLTQEGICQVYQLIEFLSKEQNIKQEGIFRRSGKLRRQQELKSLLNQGVSLDLNDGRYSVHDCASVLKNFLAELPEPLLTDAHYPAHFQIAEMCISSAEGKSDGRLIRALQLLLLLLPTENRVLLSDLLGLLNLTASHQSSNRMSAESLATLFTPHLACPRKLPPEALHANAQLMSRVIAFMIHQGASSLFSIPPQLATDIRAYWVRKEATGSNPPKKVDSGYDSRVEKKGEEESAEVNTVFSFVDRERTAQAHHSNPTEAALAQLYAHIRSLPESSEKRRLVKQFNKENGLGTPHQHYPRILNPRGLSDSIKKHLFHKGIKCPKNGANQGHFNVLQQNCGDKSNNQEKTTSNIKLMMFQKSMDDLSPLSKTSSHFSPSSLSSGDKEEPVSQLSQRKLNFSDSPSDNSCIEQNIISVKHINVPKEIEACIQLQGDAFKNDINSTLKTIEEENLKSSMINDSWENMRPPHQNKSIINLSGNSSSNDEQFSKGNVCNNLQNKVDEYHSPFKQPCDTEGNNWLQIPNVSPLPYTVIPSKQGRPLEHERALVTSTPANQRPRYTPRLRARSSIETSLLCHQTSCMLTPVTSEENSSMSPITRSTQKMSKAMQETMMTPRSRKPVLVLSGSNISHVPSIGHCSQMLTEDKIENSGLIEQKVDTPDNKNTMNRESIESCLELADQETNENDKVISNSKNIVNANDLKNSDSQSLTSTFINYIESRSVLTASPVDLSFKDNNSSESSIMLDLNSLKSEEHLSDSLLYCLDGNDPLSVSFSDPEAEKASSNYSEQDSMPTEIHSRKRKSAEMNKEESVNDSPQIKIIPGRLQDSVENSSLSTPKNKHLFETSL